MYSIGLKLQSKGQYWSSDEFHISPHWVMTTGTRGLFEPSEGIFSTLRTINIPSSITLPKTTCFESRKSHLVQVMKN